MTNTTQDPKVTLDADSNFPLELGIEVENTLSLIIHLISTDALPPYVGGRRILRAMLKVEKLTEDIKKEMNSWRHEQ